MKGEVTWDYAKRKRGDQERPTGTIWFEPVLEETYGLIAYQEQVMEISKQLGGFSGAEADDMRKAMGKLYRIKGNAAKEFMSQYETKWFNGCAKRQIPSKVADEIWHKLLEFGHYGFNKSHSATYARQAYQDMWLKINYPLEFYAAFLTFEDDEDKKMIAIREARSRGVEILPPSAQTSNIGWTVDGDSLRMGLLAIKGVGEKGAAMIVTQRAGGDYESVEDFRKRVPAKSINAKAMEALEESGAFDCFGVRDAWTDSRPSPRRRRNGSA
jgi:DNA polymerase-3 subunit alpha